MFACGMFALAATTLGVRAWRNPAMRTRRLLRRTRVTPISELVDGELACIVGVVHVDRSPINAPQTGRPCVAYDTTTWHVDPAGTFTRVQTARDMVPFFIVDDSGAAWIDAPEAALSNPAFTGTDYEERLIEDGARVRLVGSVRLMPSRRTAEVGFRQFAVSATLTGSKRYPLLVDIERA